MEERKVTGVFKLALFVSVVCLLGGLAFAAGFSWSMNAHADESEDSDRGARVIYPKKTELDFDGINIEGEVRNPGEFYFQRRGEEKFDSLVKRRKNFHHEMLRDAVLSR